MKKMQAAPVVLGDLESVTKEGDLGSVTKDFDKWMEKLVVPGDVGVVQKLPCREQQGL